MVSHKILPSANKLRWRWRASEERYRTLTELTSDYAYFFRINEDGTQFREWITDSVKRVTGYSAEEMPQTPDELAKIFLPGEIVKAVDEIKLLKQGQIVNSEISLHTKDNSLVEYLPPSGMG